MDAGGGPDAGLGAQAGEDEAQLGAGEGEAATLEAAGAAGGEQRDGALGGEDAGEEGREAAILVVVAAGGGGARVVLVMPPPRQRQQLELGADGAHAARRVNRHEDGPAEVLRRPRCARREELGRVHLQVRERPVHENGDAGAGAAGASVELAMVAWGARR